MNSQKQLLQTRLDIEAIYNKGRKLLIIDEQRNKNMINYLKYADKLIISLRDTTNKNGQVYARYHKSFKNLRGKMIAELKYMGDEGGQMGQAVRKILNQIIQQLSAKARKFEQSQKRIKEMVKVRVSTEQENEEQQERVHEQMLDLIQQFKSQAVEMGEQLKKDNSVIENIASKQQKVSRNLTKETDSVKELNSSKSLGFFTLIGYSAIAVLLWIFTMFFILVF